MHTSTRLIGKAAVVTGAARGMGRCMAHALAAAGAKTVVADLDGAGAAAVAAEIAARHGAATPAQVDVSRRDSVEALFAAIETAPDVLVCAAGITGSRRVAYSALDVPDDEVAAVLDTNLLGVFRCVQLVARRLVAEGRRGSLILVSSVGVVRPNPAGAAYHASKGGVDALVRALAVELAAYGIRVNGIAPGYMLTDMTRDAFDDDARRARVGERIPLRRIGDAADLDGLCTFLASDESGYITGQTICVDGGASVLGSMPARPLVREEHRR